MYNAVVTKRAHNISNNKLSAQICYVHTELNTSAALCMHHC